MLQPLISPIAYSAACLGRVWRLPSPVAFAQVRLALRRYR